MYLLLHLLSLIPPKKYVIACFVSYLKIIHTFLKNNTCILKQIVQKTF